MEASEVASDDQVVSFASMWRNHYLKRCDYSSDFNGLMRFLYAKHYMSTAVAESSCLAQPLCEESVDVDLLLKERVACGLTCTGVSFSRAHDGDLLGRFSQASVPRKFISGSMVTLTRTTVDECYKDRLTIK